jgi:mRNA interferase RelE/StbE
MDESIYRVEIVARAQRQLRRLQPRLQRRILDRIMELGIVQYPPGSAKLSGEDDLYRIRVGDYRVIYTVINDVLLVLVVSIGHRREIYRDL